MSTLNIYIVYFFTFEGCCLMRLHANKRERESFIAICKLFIQINTHKLFLVKMKWVNQTTNQKIYILIVHEHVD